MCVKIESYQKNLTSGQEIPLRLDCQPNYKTSKAEKCKSDCRATSTNKLKYSITSSPEIFDWLINCRNHCPSLFGLTAREKKIKEQPNCSFLRNWP